MNEIMEYFYKINYKYAIVFQVINSEIIISNYNKLKTLKILIPKYLNGNCSFCELTLSYKNIVK